MGIDFISNFYDIKIKTYFRMEQLQTRIMYKLSISRPDHILSKLMRQILQ